MKTRLISLAASLLLAASFNTASATYYLVAASHDWNVNNGIPFIGTTLTTTISGEFKIVDVQEWNSNNTVWYGAEADGHFELNSMNHYADFVSYANSPNFYLQFPLEYTFTIVNNNALSVSGFKYYIEGNFNNWSRDEMTYDNGTYSIVKTLAAGDRFKFRDFSGDNANQYGGNTNNETYVIHNGWFSDIALKLNNGCKDFVINRAGTYTFKLTSDRKLTVEGFPPLLTLNNESDFSNIGETVDVILGNRTLAGGAWNTFCVPFNIASFDGTPLEGATVKTLQSATLNSNGVLSLVFGNSLSSIEAGKPYIVKPQNDVNEVRFNGVTMTNNGAISVGGTDFRFTGCYNETPIEGPDYLYIGAGNKIYYPEEGSNFKIGAFRAYFERVVPGAPVKAFELNFGDDTNSIEVISNEASSNDDYYTIDGRHLNGKPSTSGLFIHNGRKIIIK